MGDKTVLQNSWGLLVFSQAHRVNRRREADFQNEFFRQVVEDQEDVVGEHGARPPRHHR